MSEAVLETRQRVKAETQQRFAREEAAYWRQRDELLKLYAGKWVAIVNEQVAAVGEQMNKVAAEASRKTGSGLMYVQLVGKEDLVLRVRQTEVCRTPFGYAPRLTRLAATIVFLILAIELSGCASDQAQSPQSATKAVGSTLRPLINIPSLAGKTALEVEQVLGKPGNVATIKNYPAQMPGEQRKYTVGGDKEGLTIRFYRGRAIHFTLYLPTATELSEDAIKLVGIDLQGATPVVKAPAADRWVGTFAGVRFKDLSAQTDFGSSKYSIVQAEIEP